MIIIQLAGGLGNQLFQYALFLQLKSLGKDVKIDDEAGFVSDEQRVMALSPFGVEYERPSKKERTKMLDASPLLWHKVRRKLFGRHKKAYFEQDKLFHPEIFTWDDIYLEGYWQTEKYFAQVSDRVRDSYDISKMVQRLREAYTDTKDEAVKNSFAVYDELLDEMHSGQSVSVHVRRGDYLLAQNQELFGNICTEAYYEKAIEKMMQQYGDDARFYLFTNDKEWAKTGSAFGGKVNYRVIDLPDTEVRDYLEFALMSSCRNNILANSSFSWWASYLNGNKDKIVIAPKRWLNGWDCSDFYREDMSCL